MALGSKFAIPAVSRLTSRNYDSTRPPSSLTTVDIPRPFWAPSRRLRCADADHLRKLADFGSVPSFSYLVLFFTARQDLMDAKQVLSALSGVLLSIP